MINKFYLRYRSAPLLGTREILDEEDEVQPNGKMFKKYIMGDYRWISFEDADTSADYFGRGLRALGMKTQDKVCVFAETRAGKNIRHYGFHEALSGTIGSMRHYGLYEALWVL